MRKPQAKVIKPFFINLFFVLVYENKNINYRKTKYIFLVKLSLKISNQQKKPGKTWPNYVK